MCLSVPTKLNSAKDGYFVIMFELTIIFMDTFKLLML